MNRQPTRQTNATEEHANIEVRPATDNLRIGKRHSFFFTKQASGGSLFSAGSCVGGEWILLGEVFWGFVQGHIYGEINVLREELPSSENIP